MMSPPKNLAAQLFIMLKLSAYSLEIGMISAKNIGTKPDVSSRLSEYHPKLA
jgi:hypothetical protein